MTVFSPLRYFLLINIALLAFVPAGPAGAQEEHCAACHEQLISGKSIHPAVAMGCATCHSAVDAEVVPHKITNRNPRGLAAKMKDLCFNCHDRAPFQKTTVHGALLLGCTSCHNPHATNNASILKDGIPRLCLNCHAERLKEQNAGAHPLAGNEACSSCHHPHASDAPKLVRTQPENSAKGETALVRKPGAVQQ